MPGGEPLTQYAKGDASIAYQVLGDGDRDILLISESMLPIEALHDNAFTARFLARLTPWGRVLLFDRRGVGLSDPASVSAPPTLEDWVADSLAVLDAVGSEQAAVIATGASAGFVALLLAATRPERVCSLVLYDAIARYRWAEDYPWGVAAEVERALVERMREQWGSAEIVDRRGRYSAALARHPEITEWAVQWTRRGASPATALALNHVLHDSDLRHVLRSISAPTLIINHAGTGDGGYLAEHIPDARLLEIQDPQHLVFSAEMAGALAAMSELINGSQIAPSPERVLATVLFTDIVGSTQRVAESGDRRWREVLDRHDQMVRRQLNRFSGRAVKFTGDGFLATFDGPARGVQCALAIREGAAQQDISVRAGLHTGEVELRGDDVAGVAVHIAERISGLAAADEILVSRTVVDLVVGSGLAFDERGEQHLKGLERPWVIFAASGAVAS